MKPEEIRIHCQYAGHSGALRRVCSIDGGMVFYVLEGFFSLTPLQCSLTQFAGWAVRKV